MVYICCQTQVMYISAMLFILSNLHEINKKAFWCFDNTFYTKMVFMKLPPLSSKNCMFQLAVNMSSILKETSYGEIQ